MSNPNYNVRCPDWDEDIPVTHQGFDLHVYYLPEQKEEAVALKAKFVKKFAGGENVVIHPNDNPVDTYDAPRGPHSRAMWIAEARTPQQFATMVPWMALNHGTISVLVHPNTRNSKRDHTVAAMWLGEPCRIYHEMFGS